MGHLRIHFRKTSGDEKERVEVSTRGEKGVTRAKNHQKNSFGGKELWCAGDEENKRNVKAQSR